MEKLLTVKDVAELLQVKPSTVYHWASIGLLPVIPLHRGKRKTVWRFSREKIEEWLRNRQSGEKKAIAR